MTTGEAPRKRPRRGGDASSSAPSSSAPSSWSFRRFGANLGAERCARFWDLLCGTPLNKDLLAELHSRRTCLYEARQGFDEAGAAFAEAIFPGGGGGNIGIPTNHAARVAVSGLRKSAIEVLRRLEPEFHEEDVALKTQLTGMIGASQKLSKTMASLVLASEDAQGALASLDARQRSFVANVMALTEEMLKGHPPYWDLGPLAPGIYGWKQREVDRGCAHRAEAIALAQQQPQQQQQQQQQP